MVRPISFVLLSSVPLSLLVGSVVTLASCTGDDTTFAGDDGGGGTSYADPVAVVMGPSGKAYVPRFHRNKLAVIDIAQPAADAAAPVKTIDFSSYLDPADRDGNVDMAGAVYVASQQRLYV